MGDDVERLLAAVIGMRAPADVGEQARGVAQPPLLGGLVKAGRGHEAVGPADQFFAVARRARAQLIEIARRLDQRVLLLVLLLEQRIEQALAHAERGEHHLPRLADAQDVFEHQRRIGQAAAAARSPPPRYGQRLDVDAVQQLGEFERLVGRDRVAVHDVQRIAGLPHVQPRQRPPGAADGIKGAVARRPSSIGSAASVFLTNFSAFLSDFAEMSASARPPSGRVKPVARARAVHVDQFERAAAEIADDAVGPMHAGDDAERGQFGLARAREHLDIGADGALGELDESARRSWRRGRRRWRWRASFSRPSSRTARDSA